MVANLSLDFDPYRKWLGISEREQPPHHYRLLGLETFESDPEVIENAADARIRHLRSFQSGPRAEVSQRLLNEVAAARHSLLNDQLKAQYDAALRETLARRWKNPPPRKPPVRSLQPHAPSLSAVVPLPEFRRQHRRRDVPIAILLGSGLLALLILVGFTALLATHAGSIAEKQPSLSQDAEEETPTKITGTLKSPQLDQPRQVSPQRKQSPPELKHPSAPADVFLEQSEVFANRALQRYPAANEKHMPGIHLQLAN